MPKINHKTLWEKILKSVVAENVFQEIAVESWLKPLIPVKYVDGILFLETENNFAPTILKHKYNKKLSETARQIDENFVNMKFGIVGEKDIQPDEKTAVKINTAVQKNEKPAEKTVKSALFAHPVNKQYRFSNFVAAFENQLAVASAEGISKQPGKMPQYNPFFIYGNAGVGKTHLLHAIANEVAKDTKKQVLLISGEEFHRNWSAHLHKKKYDAFASAFEQANIVLFDNIHELSAKYPTQIELYKIFNKFHQQNKQIVFTANCSPAELSGFEERIITRLQWGLSVKLDAQDIETRIEILRNMASNLKLKLSNEEIEYIVENCSENIHDLQGIIVNISAEVSLNKTEIGDAVRKALGNRKIEPVKGFVSPKTITDAVSSFYKIDLIDIKGKSRVAAVATARQVAAYLLRKYTPLSFAAIGQELGGKNHATIVHSVNEIENRTKNEERTANEIKEICKILTRN